MQLCDKAILKLFNVFLLSKVVNVWIPLEARILTVEQSWIEGAQNPMGLL